MTLFVASTLLWDLPVDEAVRQAKYHGLDGMEVWAEHVWHSRTSPVKILREAKNAGLTLSLHASSWDLNLCALNDGIRRQSVREIEKSIELAAMIEAPVVTVHPGRRTLTRDWEEWHFESLVESLYRLSGCADKWGVTLSIELMEHIKKEFVTVPSVMNRLLNHLPERVGVTFDIAHVPLQEDILQYYGELKRINKIHISDTSENAFHLPLGQGSIRRLPDVLSKLLQEEIPMVVEGYDRDPGHRLLKRNLDYLHDHFDRLRGLKIAGER